MKHICEASNPIPTPRCSAGIWGSIIAVVLAGALSLAARPAPPGVGCVAPAIDGNLQDMIDFASCLQPADGCGFVVVDPEKDICAPNTGFIPCDASEACPGGGSAIYFANGADLILAIFAYDRASDTFFAGFRVVSGHAIGDADGGGTANDDCGAPGNIIDQAGIGSAEPYDVFIDTNCDGKPEFTVEVSGNALKVNGVAVPAGDGSFAVNGSNLEIAVEGLGLPPVTTFKGQAGFSFDGLQEDNTEPATCGAPNAGIDVACSGPTSLCAGQTGDYTVTVTNTGQATLAPASATITLPGGLNFVAIVDQDGWDSVAHNAGVITANEASLPVGESRPLTFTVAAKDDCFGDVTIASSAQGIFSQAGCVDEVVAVDGAACTVMCQGLPAITLDASGPDSVCPGSPYTVTGAATNTSPSKTEDIAIAGPDGFLVVCNAVPPGGTCPFSQDFVAPSPCGGPTIEHSYTASAENVCGGAEDTDLVTIACGEDQECPPVTSSISSNFNGTPILAGRYIWFPSVFKYTGPETGPVTITVDNAFITFSANGVNYNLPVPRAVITLSPSATLATTTFNNGLGQWVTTAPFSADGNNLFIAGLAFQVPVNFPGGINPVVWRADFSSSISGVEIKWQWSAAVYTTFSSNYNALGVKPCGGNNCSAYLNSHPAGTPENFRQFVIGGARGGGGSNFTGSLSATRSVALICTPCVPLLKSDGGGHDISTLRDGEVDHFALGTGITTAQLVLEPNPFRGTTRVGYALPSTGPVRLVVYDVSGRVVDRLVEATQPAGRYIVSWDGNGRSSGIYFFRLEAGNEVRVERATLMR